MNKKQNLIALVITSCICLGSVTARAVPTISLNVLDPFITVGETFSVQVQADSNDPAELLLAFGFNVTSSLQTTYTGFTLGPGFIDNGSGGLVVRADTITPGSQALLATLSFTANSVGTGTLNIQGTVNGSDGLYTTIESYPIDVSRSITVNAAGVPDSASLWMAALTLTGLCLWRVGSFKPTC